MPFSIDLQNLQNLQNLALRTQPCTQSICKPSCAHVAHIAPKGVLGCHLVSPVKHICLVYSPAVPWVSNSLPNCNCIPYFTKFPSWVYWLSADAIAKVRHTAWGELCVETVCGDGDMHALMLVGPYPRSTLTTAPSRRLSQSRGSLVHDPRPIVWAECCNIPRVTFPCGHGVRLVPTAKWICMV